MTATSQAVIVCPVVIIIVSYQSVLQLQYMVMDNCYSGQTLTFVV